MRVTFENYPAHQKACQKALEIAVAEGLEEVMVYAGTCRIVVKKTDNGYSVRAYEDTAGFVAGDFAKECEG